MATTIAHSLSQAVSQAVPLLVHFPKPRFWVDYDQEADVLYISFDRPQNSTDSEMTDEGILLRYRNDQLVGVTVLDASTRSAESSGKVSLTRA